MRVFTFKNAAWLALAGAIGFAAFSAWMEFRSRGGSEYGRLYESRIEVTKPPAARQPREVIREAPEPTIAGPALNDRSLDDGFLGVHATATTAPAETAAVPAPAVQPPMRLRRGGKRIVITGGAAGVRVDEQTAAPRPPASATPVPPAGEPVPTTTDPTPSR